MVGRAHLKGKVMNVYSKFLMTAAEDVSCQNLKGRSVQMPEYYCSSLFNYSKKVKS